MAFNTASLIDSRGRQTAAMAEESNPWTHPWFQLQETPPVEESNAGEQPMYHVIGHRKELGAGGAVYRVGYWCTTLEQARRMVLFDMIAAITTVDTAYFLGCMPTLANAYLDNGSINPAIERSASVLASLFEARFADIEPEYTIALKVPRFLPAPPKH